jgi:hypothetical protein
MHEQDAWSDEAVKLAQALVRSEDWVGLVELVRRASGALWILEGIDDEAGFVVGAALARLMVGNDELFGADVHLARPDGDRWRLEEIDSQVITPGRVAPQGELRVVVVGWGDKLGAAGADHLLKTFEDCGPQTRFVLVVGRADALPVTVVGRAAVVARVAMAGPEARMVALVESGNASEVVREVFSLCGTQVSLATAVLAKPELLGDLRTVLGGRVDLGAPVCAALNTSGALERLVKAVPGDEKVLRRQLVGALLGVLSERVLRLLRRAAARGVYTRRVAELEAIDGAQRALGVYVNPSDVLCVLYIRLAQAVALESGQS